ncbi:MAG TPA: hypothetical protein PK467_03910, partial [Candidatus Wallbacteria bacterium]|nr:hypothetical protein [Candidatus Wallbacteria bacterium]
MFSYKNQRLLLVLTLFLSTVFLYGCNGGTSSSGVTESSMRFEIRDITTKAPLDNVNVMISGPDPQSDNGPVSILRQLKTDSRGKVTAGDLPPDRKYTVTISKEGYQNPPAGANVQPQFIPDIHDGIVVEQGKTYDIIGYLIRADSPATGTIKGYVKNRVTGEPITNATVFTSPQNNFASIIDTTDKPSKPGYYELSNVPSGNNTLNASIPGVTAAMTYQVTVPGNGTIEYDILVDPGNGTINGNILAAANETLAPGVYIVQVLRNGTDVVASYQKSVTDITTASTDFSVANVPVIMTGSTSSYTVKITSDSGHMINPAGGISGVVLRQSGQTVQVSPITMQSEKGTILVTLYHAPIDLTTNLTHVSEATMSTMAPQATVSVDGAII